MSIPNDPMILLSFINTRLRDQHISLQELCHSLDVSEKDIVEKLQTVGFEYNAELNRFL